MSKVFLSIYDGNEDLQRYDYSNGLQKAREIFQEKIKSCHGNYFYVGIEIKDEEKSVYSPWFCIRRHDLYLVGILLDAAEDPKSKKQKRAISQSRLPCSSEKRPKEVKSIYLLTDTQITYDNSPASLTVESLSNFFYVLMKKSNLENLKNSELKSVIFWICEAAKFEVVATYCIRLSLEFEFQSEVMIDLTNHTSWRFLLNNFEKIFKKLLNAHFSLPIKPFISLLTSLQGPRDQQPALSAFPTTHSGNSLAFTPKNSSFALAAFNCAAGSISCLPRSNDRPSSTYQDEMQFLSASLTSTNISSAIVDQSGDYRNSSWPPVDSIELVRVKEEELEWLVQLADQQLFRVKIPAEESKQIECIIKHLDIKLKSSTIISQPQVSTHQTTVSHCVLTEEILTPRTQRIFDSLDTTISPTQFEDVVVQAPDVNAKSSDNEIPKIKILLHHGALWNVPNKKEETAKEILLERPPDQAATFSFS